MGKVFPHLQQAMLQAPAGYHRFQPNSDTIYPEIASDSAGKGLRPTGTPSTSDTNCKPSLLPVFLTDWLQIGGSCDPVLGLQTPVTSPDCYIYF